MTKKTVFVNVFLITLAFFVCVQSADATLITTQTWTFDNGDNPAIPESYDNPGLPLAFIDALGDQHVPNPGWKASWLGHDGVWAADTVDIRMEIPNFANQNKYKEIWVDVTFFGFLNVAQVSPGVVTDLGQTIVELSDGWKTLSIGWKIEPNPDSEQIWLGFIDSGAAVDDVYVWTECVPEPTTICLLGLGGLLLRRKRKV